MNQNVLQGAGEPTPETTPPPINGCGSPKWFQDGWCDDENNNAGCKWDGGDCCNNTNPEWKEYCKICKCRDPNAGAKFYEITT